MIDNERELAGAVERLEIDTQPGAAHRAELRRQMLAAFEQASYPAIPKLKKEVVLRMILRTRYVAAAAVVVLVTGVLCVMTLTGTESTIAYGQVRERLESAKTISYTQTVPLASGQRLRKRMMCKGRNLLRMEITPLKPDGKPYYAGGPSVIMIADSRIGKMLALYPEKKTATVQSFGELPPNARRVGMTFDDLKALLKGKDKPLGEKKIDGKRARGFQVTSPKKVIEVWVDAATDDPLLLVIPTSQKGRNMIIRDIVLGGALDDSLFSLKPPEDYFDTQAKFGWGDPSEKDVILLLRIWAMGGGDTFPNALDARKFPEAGGKVNWKRLDVKSQEEADQASSAITRAFWWLYSGHQWTYAGKGVRLGEKDKPVFWYRPKKSKTYRVIYGDLSVKDVRPEDLPKAPLKRAETRPAVESG